MAVGRRAHDRAENVQASRPGLRFPARIAEAARHLPQLAEHWNAVAAGAEHHRNCDDFCGRGRKGWLPILPSLPFRQEAVGETRYVLGHWRGFGYADSTREVQNEPPAEDGEEDTEWTA